MENKIQQWMIIFIIALIRIPCVAQSPDEIEDMMDKIKLDETFIYGEAYSDDKEMAYQNALSELLSSINELRDENGSALISISDLQPIIKELRYTKGNKNLSFLYLPLSQALSLSPKTRHDNITNNSAPQQVEQSQAIESEKEEKSPQLTFVPGKPTNQVTSTPTQAPTEILEILCGQDNWIEIRGFLISFKEEGKIKETGKCLSFTEVPDDAYSILMDEMGGILSIMSPKNSPNRINHRTNQADNENNHENCKFIVWYK